MKKLLSLWPLYLIAALFAINLQAATYQTTTTQKIGTHTEISSARLRKGELAIAKDTGVLFASLTGASKSKYYPGLNSGPQGPTGPQGPQGVAGTAATATAGSTTTGAPGTSATVTNSGTTSAAIFDFVIPRGETGLTGATGPAGPTIYPGTGIPSSTGSAWGSSHSEATFGDMSSHRTLTTSAHGGIVSSGDSRLTDARTPTSHGNEKHSATYITAADAVPPDTFKAFTSVYLRKNGATAADQVYVSDGIGSWILKTLAQIKAWLGLGSAAYTASTDYAQELNFRNTSTASAAHRALTTTAHGGIVAPDTTFGTYTGMWRKTSTSAISYNGTVTVSANLAGGVATLRNSNVSGWSSFDLRNSANSSSGGFGYGNASAAAFADKVYLYSNTKDIYFSVDGGTNTALSLLKTSGNLGIGLTALGTSAAKALGIADGTAPVTSVAGAQIGSTAADGLYIMPSGSTATTKISATKMITPGDVTTSAGYSVYLTAGEALYKGEVVYSSTSADLTVLRAPTSNDMPLGVVIDDTCAQSTTTCRIGIGGLAYLQMEGAATRGHVAIVSATISGTAASQSSVTAGEHNRELGHPLQTTTSNTVATTAVDTTNDTITVNAHGWANGTPVTYRAGGGTVLAGLTDRRTYYVVSTATNTFKLSLTIGGAAIDLTGTGNNAQSFTQLPLSNLHFN